MSQEIVNAMPQNEPTGKHVRTRSRFPLQYHNFDTMRYGEYHPHFVMDTVAKDDISFRSSHDLRSYTLQAPLMEDISMKKDYFNVPMQAILPNNWDKFFANPVKGQDVPGDCGCAYSAFYGDVSTLLKNLTDRVRAVCAQGSTFTDVQTMTSILRFLVVSEYFLSTGSLLSTLGVHTYEYFIPGVSGVYAHKTFDGYFDAIVNSLISNVKSIIFTDSNNKQFTGYFITDPDVFSVRDILQFFRDDPGSSVTTVTFNSGKDLDSLKAAFLTNMFTSSRIALYNVARPFNCARLAAYQLVCAHFYTNDQIDFVFDANRYRELMWYYHRNLMASTSSFTDQFIQNGIKYDYDAFSGHCLGNILKSCIATSSTTLLYGTSSVQVTNLSYLSGLFAFRKSLRFKDYFTGSHSQPLAVADQSFDASNASVIDITKNIQKQRFLNAVNRVGARIEDYMKEIFDSNLAYDYHNPSYLGHTSDVIFGSETENTGVAQQTNPNSVTSTLRSNGSRYEFNFKPDRNSVIIGITYFDIPRSYSKSIDRQTMHFDRFDYFNPYMQFIGDQELYFEELNPDANGSQTAFAYQLRHMEYKQRFNVVQGGFVEALKGWAFIADLKYNWCGYIDPFFIRSLNTELDRFYTSLSGFSLGTYFHFIVKNVNDCEASRPMAYAPSIL